MVYSLQSKIFVSILLLLLLTLLIAFCVPAFAAGAGVSGRVFLDGNANQLDDSAERGLSSVQISLIKIEDGKESVLAEALTDRTGAYHFDALQAGRYYLDIRLPSRRYFVKPAKGGSAALPAQGSRSRTPAFVLEEAQQIDLPIGTTQRPAYFNFVAFEDINRNGSRYSTEPLMKDVEVIILFQWQGETYEIARGLTNRKGFAQFRYLTPAEYSLRAILPASYQIGPRGAKDNVFFNVFVPSGEHEGTAGPYDLETMRGLGISGIQ